MLVPGHWEDWGLGGQQASPGPNITTAQNSFILGMLWLAAQQLIKVEIVSPSPLIFFAAVTCFLSTFQPIGAEKLSWRVSLPVVLSAASGGQLRRFEHSALKKPGKHFSVRGALHTTLLFLHA